MMILHHHGIVVPDLAAAQAFYERLGATCIGGPYDDPIQKARLCFLALPGNRPLVELIAPYSPDAPVAGFLAKYGGGLHHTCYMVADLAQAMQRVGQAGGLPVFGPVTAVAFAQRQIAFMYLRDRSLLEFVEAADGLEPAEILYAERGGAVHAVI